MPDSTISADSSAVAVRGGTILSGDNRDAPVPSNIEAFTSEQQAVFDVVTIGTEKVLVQKGTTPASNVTKAMINRRLTVPGQLSPGSTDYTNRPSITVVKVTNNDAVREEPLGSYSDWFVSSVQEQDMERTDIIETFGAPHIFTSGRFTRKMVFSGIVRTTAHNFASTVTINRVPQHVLLRNFYEKFLRATAQAQSSTFSRMFVDGDIYEGYCIGLQLPRDAGVEMVMQFSLSMIIVRRYNMHDADAVSALSRFKTLPSRRLTPSFASAEMKDTGDFVMRVSAGNAPAGTQVGINLGKVNQNGTFQGVPPVINLEAPYSGQTITVEGATGVWTLKYADDGALVSGSPSRQGTSRLTLELASYARLVDVGKIVNGTEALTLTLKAKGITGPSIIVTSITSDKPTLVLKDVNLILTGGARTRGVINNDSDASMFVTKVRETMTSPFAESWQLVFDVEITLATFDKALLPAGAIAAPLTATMQSVDKTIPQRAGAADTVAFDVSIVNPNVNISAMVVTNPSPSVFRFSGLSIAMRSSLNVTQLNPFAVADSIKAGLEFHVQLPSYDEFTAKLHVDFTMGKSQLIPALIDGGGYGGNFSKLNVSAASVVVDGTSQKVVYIGSLKLPKTKEAKSFNLTAADYASLLSSATLALQYSQGTVACRLNQPGTAQLQLKDGTQQFDILTTLDASAVDTVLVTLQFKAPSSTKTADLQSVLSSAVSAEISFPSAYSLPSIPIRFA